VKSANIGLALRPDGSLYAKLLDCGLAKAQCTEASAALEAGVSFTGGLAAGTPGYMAPEILRGDYTVASEVYSSALCSLSCCYRPATSARRMRLPKKQRTRTGHLWLLLHAQQMCGHASRPPRLLDWSLTASHAGQDAPRLHHQRHRSPARSAHSTRGRSYDTPCATTCALQRLP